MRTVQTSDPSNLPPSMFEGETMGAFIEKARRRFRGIADAESALRSRMIEDQQFRASEIWPTNIKQDRIRDGRPCFTINPLNQFLRQITNAQRASRPGIQVNPVDSGADPAVAEALQGVIRSIEVNSDADIAYSTGCDNQVTTGRGYWRVLAKYADDDGYEQVLSIEEILNPLTVYVDVAAVKADASDARFAFIVEDVPKDEFRELYGEEKAASASAFFQAQRESTAMWLPEGKIRVAEYFYTVNEKETIVWMKHPDVQYPDKQVTTRMRKEDLPEPVPKNWQKVSERTVTIRKVKWCKMTGVDILEGNDDLSAGRDFPSKFIPIVQVLGDRISINGTVDLRGVVRDSKDAVIKYNFWDNAITEQIALTPRAPYIAAEGQISGEHEDRWNTSNRKNWAYLTYKPKSLDGQLLPPPQRQQFSPHIEAVVQAFTLSYDNLKASVGMYEPTLGAPGPEQSGKAILARQRQGELGNSNYMDNLGRAIRFTGRILLDMIPRIYTPERILKILGVDDSVRTIMLTTGQIPEDADKEALMAATGVDAIYDISVGRYDVSISMGASYASRRTEAVEAMLQLVNSAPQFAPIIADLLVGNMDWPGAARVAARLKRMVPAQALGPDEQPQTPPPIPPEAVQQMQQQLQELMLEKKTRTDELQSKERMKAADIHSRELVELRKVDASLAETFAKIKASRGELILQGELDRIHAQLEHLLEQSALPPQGTSTATGSSA